MVIGRNWYHYPTFLYVFAVASSPGTRRPLLWPTGVQSASCPGYNGGLFVLKLDHVPTACGAWPAFWMFGDDAQHSWPRWGEYDILDTWQMKIDLG
jgi:hypothetical protein